MYWLIIVVIVLLTIFKVIEGGSVRIDQPSECKPILKKTQNDVEEDLANGISSIPTHNKKVKFATKRDQRVLIYDGHTGETISVKDTRRKT